MASRRRENSSSDEEDEARRQSAFSSRITPWISSFLLEEISRSSSSNPDYNHRPRMVEILERGGDFWDYDKHNTTNPDAPLAEGITGWLLVTDGQYSIKMHLSNKCAAAMWKKVSSVATRPMYAFLNYSRGHCGILQQYHLSFDGTAGQYASRFDLFCDEFTCQPQLQNMIVTNNTMIQSIDANVEVKYALQSYKMYSDVEADDDTENQNTRTATPATSPATTTTKVGDVQDALDDDKLMDAIMKQTEYNLQQEKKHDGMMRVAESAASNMKAPVVVRPRELSSSSDEDDDDDDDSALEPMNISDMLASEHTPDDVEQLKRALAIDDDDDIDDLTGGLGDDDLLQLELPKHPSPAKRIKLQTRTRLPKKMPVFEAFCKKLNDPYTDVIDIPELEPSRISFAEKRFGSWLDDIISK